MMIITRSRLFLSFLCHIPRRTLTLASRIPVQYRLKPKQIECVYDKLAVGEVVTYSVFIVEAMNNGKPKASISFAGPVSHSNILPKQANDVTMDQKSPGDRGKVSTGREITSGIIDDWPKLDVPHAPNEVIRQKLKVDWTHAGKSEDDAIARSGILENNHEEFRQHILKNKGKDESDVTEVPLHTIAKTEITPFEETRDIMARGWYRLCVESDSAPLLVEIDMRTANKLKGVNPGTGHVYTYELREYLDEKLSMFGVNSEERKEVDDTTEGHKPLEAQDFTEAKLKLNYIHTLTSEIMRAKHQHMQRHRTHRLDAQRGAAEMERSSKFETLLFVIIAVFQVITVHKWLLNDLLGK